MDFKFSSNDDTKDQVWIDAFTQLISLATIKDIDAFAKNCGAKVITNDKARTLNNVISTVAVQLKTELSRKKEATGRPGVFTDINFFTKTDLLFIARCIQKLFKNVDLEDTVFSTVKDAIKSFNPDALSKLKHEELVKYICDGFQYVIAYVWQSEHFKRNKEVKKLIFENFEQAKIDILAKKPEILAEKKETAIAKKNLKQLKERKEDLVADIDQQIEAASEKLIGKSKKESKVKSTSKEPKKTKKDKPEGIKKPKKAPK